MNIKNRLPVNKTAAIVVGKGVDYDAPINPKANKVFQDKPPKIRAFTGCDDLSGVKFGRFTVVGLSLDFNSRWVVRCACGNFEMRKAKSIKNKSNSIDCCLECRHLIYLKRNEVWRNTGKDKDPVNFA